MYTTSVRAVVFECNASVPDTKVRLAVVNSGYMLDDYALSIRDVGLENILVKEPGDCVKS